MRIVAYIMAVLLLIIVRVPYASEGAAQEIYPVAILDFGDKGLGLQGMGEKVGTLIFANLVTAEEISLVERKELQSIEDEAALNLSGMVNPMQANRIGQLTGARILVTGTVFEIDQQLMIVAKVIGTETGRVIGASVEGGSDDNVATLSKRLATMIEGLIRDKANLLVAAPKDDEAQWQALRQRLAGYAKPSLVVDIHEHHISRNAADPAAETAMLQYGKVLGFEIVDKDSDRTAGADVMITGEGFSELAARRGDLLSVKARLEVKAVNQRTGKIIAVDRQTEMEVDLSEISAAKMALERAAEKIAQRMLPQLVMQ